MPGIGIASVFYVAAALVAPVLEIVKALRGDSSAKRWRAVGRQFSLALIIVGSLVALYLSIDELVSSGLLSVSGAAEPPGGLPNWMYAVGIFGILLIGVTLTAWGAALWVRRTGMEDNEVIAQAYRASVPSNRTAHHETLPRGRHVAPLPQRSGLRPGTSTDHVIIELRPPGGPRRLRGRHLSDEELENVG
jgi:hypothetical protein